MKKKVVIATLLVVATMLFGCGADKNTQSNQNPAMEATDEAAGNAHLQEEGDGKTQDIATSDEAGDASESAEKAASSRVVGGLNDSDAVYFVFDDKHIEEGYRAANKDAYITSLVTIDQTVFFAESEYSFANADNFSHIYQLEAGGEAKDLLGALSYSDIKLFARDGGLYANVTLGADEDFKMVEISYESAGNTYREASRRELSEEEAADINLYSKYSDFELEHQVNLIKEVDAQHVYFAADSEQPYGLGTVTVYAGNPQSGELQQLYQCEEAPGIPNSQGIGTVGFQIIDNVAYFRDTDGKQLIWCAYDLDAPENGKQKLSGGELTFEHMQKGTVTYESEQKKCDDCDMIVHSYYVEQYALNSDQPNAEKINQKLADYYKEHLAMGQGMGEGLTEEDISYMHAMSYDSSYNFTYKVSDIRTIGHYLEVNFEGYEYTGGAHGYPLRDHLLFDLSTGELVSMKDLFSGSESIFKSIVAEWTLKDYQSGQKGYFEADSDEAFEQSVFDAVTFDHGMYFTNEGVVIEYAPYEMGPYAAGYIEVAIPYSALKIDMTK